MNENVREQYMDNVEAVKQIRCQMMLGSQGNVGRSKDGRGLGGRSPIGVDRIGVAFAATAVDRAGGYSCTGRFGKSGGDEKTLGYSRVRHCWSDVVSRGSPCMQPLTPFAE
jgi:hypothetical protein